MQLTFTKLSALACSKLHRIQHHHVCSHLPTQLPDSLIDDVVATFYGTIQSQTGFKRGPRGAREGCFMLCGGMEGEMQICEDLVEYFRGR